MHVVEHLQGGDALQTAGLIALPHDLRVIGTLLPVHPPEVHAVLLIGEVQHLEVGLEELRIQAVEGNSLAGGGIHTHGPGHGLVLGLIAAHARGGVQVQRSAKAPVVQAAEEPPVVREQLLVPGVARPALTIGAVLAAGQVPVHVHNTHAQGDILVLELIHQRQILLLRVGMVAAPPVAQGEGGQHVRRAGEAVVVLHGGGVVMPMTEEVHVRACLPGGEPAVPEQPGGAAVIQHGKAVHRADAVLNGALAVHPVQGGGGAAQVLQGLVPVMPHKRRRAQAADGQALLQGQALPAADLQHPRADDRLLPCPLRLRRRMAEVPADHRQGRVVRPRALLDAHQARADHRDAHIPALHNAPRPGRGVHLRPQIIRQALYVHHAEAPLTRAVRTAAASPVFPLSGRSKPAFPHFQ